MVVIYRKGEINYKVLENEVEGELVVCDNMVFIYFVNNYIYLISLY